MRQPNGIIHEFGHLLGMAHQFKCLSGSGESSGKSWLIYVPWSTHIALAVVIVCNGAHNFAHGNLC